MKFKLAEKQNKKKANQPPQPNPEAHPFPSLQELEGTELKMKAGKFQVCGCTHPPGLAVLQLQQILRGRPRGGF